MLPMMSDLLRCATMNVPLLMNAPLFYRGKVNKSLARYDLSNCAVMKNSNECHCIL
jgi:hypothetical protein